MVSMRYRLMGFVIAFAFTHLPLTGQEPQREDVSSIDGIIRAYYEIVSGPAGQAPDAERDRSLHHPDAWVSIAGRDPSGAPVVNVMSLDEYHGENQPRQQGFWEWETDRVVRRSGNMVHVWSSYASARTDGGEPYTHGVNSITLFDDGSRWWVMGWMFDSAAATGAASSGPASSDAVASVDREAAAEVEAREIAFAKTMEDRDFEAFLSFVSTEAVFFNGNTPLRGRAAVGAGWAPFFEGPIAPFSWRPDVVQVLESGALALSSGPVMGPAGEDRGRFNSTWRKDVDGQWRVVFDKGS